MRPQSPGSPRPTLEEYTEDRHKNKLPTPELRDEFVRRVASTMENSAKALLQAAAALRERPDDFLNQAFEPTRIGMDPDAIATLQVTCYRNGKDPNMPFVGIKGVTCIGERYGADIGVRLIAETARSSPLETTLLSRRHYPRTHVRGSLYTQTKNS